MISTTGSLKLATLQSLSVHRSQPTSQGSHLQAQVAPLWSWLWSDSSWKKTFICPSMFLVKLLFLASCLGSKKNVVAVKTCPSKMQGHFVSWKDHCPLTLKSFDLEDKRWRCLTIPTFFWISLGFIFSIKDGWRRYATWSRWINNFISLRLCPIGC